MFFSYSSSMTQMTFKALHFDFTVRLMSIYFDILFCTTRFWHSKQLKLLYEFIFSKDLFWVVKPKLIRQIFESWFLFVRFRIIELRSYFCTNYLNLNMTVSGEKMLNTDLGKIANRPSLFNNQYMKIFRMTNLHHKFQLENSK